MSQPLPDALSDSVNAETFSQQFKRKLSSCSTIGELVEELSEVFQSADLFYGHGTDNPADEAYALIFFVAGYEFSETEAVWENKPDEGLISGVVNIASRRVLERIPLPYLTGEAWFAGLRFHIDPRALIPRSPFAELIQNGFSPWVETDRSMKILDMCTGNGCIGIASSVYLPNAEVDIVDLSPDALEIARKNVIEHGVSDKVNVIQSDLFTELKGRKYDLIVSNPPYVPASSMAELPVEYRHEPEMALHADDQGMAIVDQLLSQSADYLNKDGTLIIEVGEIADAVHERYAQLPFTWLEFEYGGDGVFLLHAADLQCMGD